jgi:hypothetical protein
MPLAHVGGVPLEELLLPTLSGGALVARSWLVRLRRMREARR